VTRFLPDPPSRSGHILTQRELDAALRVLQALRRPTAASILLSWDNDMQDMLGGLQRAGYVERRGGYEQPPRKGSAPYREDTLVTTELGKEYLESIQTARSTKRKSGAQLDREIAHALAKKPRRSTAYKQELKALEVERDNLFNALGYAGNTAERVHDLHRRIEDVQARISTILATHKKI